jgi:hypothetical protein
VPGGLVDQVLTAQADDTDLNAGAAEGSVEHVGAPENEFADTIPRVPSRRHRFLFG